MSPFAKRALSVAAVIILAAGGVVFWRDRPATPPAEPPPPDLKPGWTAEAESNPVEVFQRAFWRRPGPDDRILHAERIQWSAADGVKKWQWFLAVEPGAELEKWLKDTNPFSLRKVERYNAAADSPSSQRPAWFPEEAADGWDIFRSGTMTLLFRKADRQIFATDTGGGFTEPVRR